MSGTLNDQTSSTENGMNQTNGSTEDSSSLLQGPTVPTNDFGTRPTPISTTNTTPLRDSSQSRTTPVMGLPRSRSNSVSSIRGNTTPVRIPTPTSSIHRRATTPTGTSSTSSSTATTYHSILNRPRSNPRSRTPMRTESPLNANAFRRDSIHEDDEEHQQQPTTTTTTTNSSATTLLHTTNRIASHPRRPLTAGVPVGGTAATTAGAARRVLVFQEKSSKQQPSHRKLRRWKNDSLKGLAHEFAKEKTKSGTKIAEVYLEAHANASKYKSIYQPSHPQHQSFSTMFQQEEQKKKGYNETVDEPTNNKKKKKKKKQSKASSSSCLVLQDKFFRGEIGGTGGGESSSEQQQQQLTPLKMWNRVHGRLRNVILRLLDSPSATNTIQQLETYLVSTLSSSSSSTTTTTTLFGSSTETNDKDDDALLVPSWLVKLPQETVLPTSQKLMIRFTFPANAGLERLFLHAICQFHGLHTASMDDTSNATNTNGNNMKKKGNTANRCIMVSGKVEGSNIQLLETVHQEQEQQKKNTPKEPKTDHHDNGIEGHDISELTMQIATVKVVE